MNNCLCFFGGVLINLFLLWLKFNVICFFRDLVNIVVFCLLLLLFLVFLVILLCGN